MHRDRRLLVDDSHLVALSCLSWCQWNPPRNKLTFTGWLRGSILRRICWSFLFWWLRRAQVNFWIWEAILLTHLPGYYNNLSGCKNKILICSVVFQLLIIEMSSPIWLSEIICYSKITIHDVKLLISALAFYAKWLFPF